MNKFYIYAFIEGHEVLYVGKGSGRRLKQQEKRFGIPGKILERLSSENEAYAREVHWISELRPTMNRNKGGAGSYSKEVVPRSVRNVMSLADWKREKAKAQSEYDEMERVGTRKYAATVLLRHVNEANCEGLGLSKVDVSRLREVAYG